MGKIYRKYLDGNVVFKCISCHSHLSCADEIISKNFHGRHGRAYLFNTAVNVTAGPIEERTLITGLHLVADIYCNVCKTIVGWKYEDAFEESEKYKVGKYILERAKIKEENTILENLDNVINARLENRHFVDMLDIDLNDE